MSNARPTSELAIQNSNSDIVNYSPKTMNLEYGFGNFLFWFIIVTVFIWLILYSTNPTWVRGSGGVLVDTGKVLLWSLIIALILVIIAWIIKAFLMPRM